MLNPLEDFLGSHDTKLCAQIGPWLTYYEVDGHAIFVYMERNAATKKIGGWNILLPASESTATADVLAAAEKYVTT